jgi:hypothetical protein
MVHSGLSLMTSMFSCVLCMFLSEIHAIFRSRLFVIYSKSKYSSDMFYDWKFPEMVHPGLLWMTDMFSCVLCMFLNEVYAIFRSRMFVIYSKFKHSSDMFYAWKFSEMVHPGVLWMTGKLSCVLSIFFLPKEHPNMFFP